MGRGMRCNKPPIQQGPDDIRQAETLVLHAVIARSKQPIQIGIATASVVSTRNHQGSDPCSRFLPYVFVWTGLLAQLSADYNLK